MNNPAVAQGQPAKPGAPDRLISLDAYRGFVMLAMVSAGLGMSHLLNDPSFRLMVEPFEIEATLLRAILHDIGHYPLSHMFEDFAEEECLSSSI